MILKLLTNYLATYLKSNSFIIVYQMGKVGSNSVVESIRKAGNYAVFHLHRLNLDNIAKTEKGNIIQSLSLLNERMAVLLYNRIAAGKRKVKIISIVREPIARNCSAFFQNFKIFTGLDYKNSNFREKELQEIFLSRYSHQVPLQWFDVEMKAVTGIDVYTHSFPKGRGYMTIREQNFELLIFKLELPDSSKEKVIAEFLNLEELNMIHRNLSENKIYSESYHNFRTTIRLPHSYIEKMLSSKYTQHFYSKDEINRFWLKWDRI